MVSTRLGQGQRSKGSGLGQPSDLDLSALSTINSPSKGVADTSDLTGQQRDKGQGREPVLISGSCLQAPGTGN